MGDHGIMARLKAETADLHREAEHRPLQRAMAKGTVSRELYGAYLGQLLLIHGGLEQALRAARPGNAAIERVFAQHQERVADLERDLAFLEVEHGEPAQGTSVLLSELSTIARKRPVALLGCLYVLEGSTNGSRFIARALAGTLGVAPGTPGLCYVDPYGDEQPQRWAQYKLDMDECDFDRDDCDAIVDAASAVFRAIMRVSDEVEQGRLAAV